MWTSVQRETTKCKAGYRGRPSNDRPTNCVEKGQSSWDDDDDDYYYGYTPKSEMEYSTATCRRVTDNEACTFWYQEEYDEHSDVFREHERYTCTKLSSDDTVCLKWSGDIDSKEEFEFSTCECDDQDATGSCHAWTCWEAALAYSYPNCWWFLLPVAPVVLWLCYADAAIDTSGRRGAEDAWSGFLCCVGPLNILMVIPGVYLGGMLVFVMNTFREYLPRHHPVHDPAGVGRRRRQLARGTKESSNPIVVVSGAVLRHHQ